MPFIIEGPDHVGKTTFAHKVVAAATSLGIPAYYAHMSTPPVDWDYYHHYIQRMAPYAVQDRFHLGGIVYAEIFRGGTKITPEKLRMLEAHLTLMGSFTCVLTSEPKLLQHRLIGLAKDEKYPINGILESNRLFGQVLREPHYAHADWNRESHAGDPYPWNDDVAMELAVDWKRRIEAARRLEGMK